MARRERRIKHSSHDGLRAMMRVVGPVLMLIGFGMFAMGVISFTTRFNEGRDEFDRNFGKFGSERVVTEKSPDRFWMCFVGAPIGALGLALARFGFLGAAARYVAGETAPVVKDTLNYVIDGAKDSIREVVQATRGEGGGGVACPACGHANDADAKFCDDCGTAMAQACPQCGKANDGDAKFCAECGTALA